MQAASLLLNQNNVTSDFLIKLKTRPYTFWINKQYKITEKVLVCLSPIASGLVKINPQFTVKCENITALHAVFIHCPTASGSSPTLSSYAQVHSPCQGLLCLQTICWSHMPCLVPVWCPARCVYWEAAVKLRPIGCGDLPSVIWGCGLGLLVIGAS